MSAPAVTAVTLVVLRCSDVAATRRFYEAVGLAFHAEKHGAGPDHWAGRAGDTVIELYPASASAATIGRLGLRVTDVRKCLDDLDAVGARIDKPFDPSTETAVVFDPDGTKIELGQRASEDPVSAAWAVWRQDDNGNRFLISRGHSREDADRRCSAFEARGHKQLYWIAPDPEDVD